MNRPQLLPYVVGQWVRGERFYGRRTQLAEILDGQRDSVWLLGTRRIGKTSLLKQVEWLTASSPERGYVPLFWDMQGATEPGELHLSFHDALLDSEERWADVGVSVSSLDPADLFDSLARVRRRVRGTGRRLLLLCDEAEELIDLQGKDRSLLPKLRRAVQSTAEVRIVLASTIRLWRLAEQSSDTSPFLHGFTPALYLATLTGEEALALVLQEPLLLPLSVAENIAYGSPDATPQKIKAVAEAAEATEFIDRLPKRYETVVGERGQKLSGGQRQRLSIARALMKNPPILILDEATSAVDNDTEAAIQRSLERISHSCTTLVIAHRLSTIVNADRIYVMDKGCIVESGRHGELLERGGIYAALWAVQTGQQSRVGVN